MKSDLTEVKIVSCCVTTATLVQSNLCVRRNTPSAACTSDDTTLKGMECAYYITKKKHCTIINENHCMVTIVQLANMFIGLNDNGIAYSGCTITHKKEMNIELGL